MICSAVTRKGYSGLRFQSNAERLSRLLRFLHSHSYSHSVALAPRTNVGPQGRRYSPADAEKHCSRRRKFYSDADESLSWCRMALATYGITRRFLEMHRPAGL